MQAQQLGQLFWCHPAHLLGAPGGWRVTGRGRGWDEDAIMCGGLQEGERENEMYLGTGRRMVF